MRSVTPGAASAARHPRRNATQLQITFQIICMNRRERAKRKTKINAGLTP